jgi:hypothetical protein
MSWLLVSKRGLWLTHFKPNDPSLASPIFRGVRNTLAGGREKGIVCASETAWKTVL